MAVQVRRRVAALLLVLGGVLLLWVSILVAMADNLSGLVIVPRVMLRVGSGGVGIEAIRSEEHLVSALVLIIVCVAWRRGIVVVALLLVLVLDHDH